MGLLEKKELNSVIDTLWTEHNKIETKRETLLKTIATEKTLSRDLSDLNLIKTLKLKRDLIEELIKELGGV